MKVTETSLYIRVMSVSTGRVAINKERRNTMRDFNLNLFEYIKLNSIKYDIDQETQKDRNSDQETQKDRK